MEEREITKVCSRLRNLLEEAVKNSLAEGILLSGGLDTSIIALLARKYVSLKAFTICLEGYQNLKRDLEPSKLVADYLGLDHKIYFFSKDELFRAVPEVIQILNNREKTIEPVGVTTAVPTYIAMRFAKKEVNSVYTGIGADELFMGYSSMIDAIGLLDSIDDELAQSLKNNMFSTVLQYCDVSYQERLGKALGLKVISPYLAIQEFPLSLPVEYKVRKVPTKSGSEKIWGKWILRKAFEGYLPKEIIWREKIPIDIGTGAIRLLSSPATTIAPRRMPARGLF